MDFWPLLVPYAAGFFRALGLCSVLPLGWSMVAASQRVLVAAAISFLLGPQAGSEFQFLPSLSGVAVGIFLGLPIALLLVAAQWVGELIDAGRGQTISAFYDPLSDAALAPFGRLLKWFAWGYLVQSGIFLHLVFTLQKSFVVFSLTAAQPTSLSSLAYSMLLLSVEQLTAAFAFALPVLMAFFLVDLLVSLLGKILPGVPLYTESFTAKLAVSIAILLQIFAWDPGGVLGEYSNLVLARVVGGGVL